MVALVHQLKQKKDHGILDEIQSVHCFSVFIEHRGRWFEGCRSASLREARETAMDAFQRSRLPTEVRREDGTVIFGVRAGYPDFVADES
ncbi:MAG: hypothetical protein O3B13_10470 [Planctomycetota bacterium]|nr:hypothetical protein [Planctomycetota bacterium]MDA1163517.1 hypothetical protein [Planctomycetota bacterium]